ncbi:NADH-quinone oxidoreductase subunit 5 family protein [Pseudonocardia nigra]|uniref:NADH-quinone oxidoreductase subunit 5 family protein n=1 Tax=Pseudonocardia nigra TaxID=1921578 RepID=UPI001FE8E702|nr:proton-conducting transporter membrane subunit [Pseudonocardia nigra]
MLLWSLIVVPLVAGGLLAVAGCRVDRAAPAVGGLVAALVLGLAGAAALTRPVVDAPLFAGIRAGLGVDGLSALMVLTVAGVTLAVVVFAAGEAELRTGRFIGLVLIFAAAMLVTVTATTLAVLLMAWEVMGAMSWALIGYHWKTPRVVEAAHAAFLTTRLADVGLYIAAGAALAGGVGSLGLDGLAATAEPWLHVVAAGLVIAALGKSAQLPFSFWLSRAMEGPGPVSALLHSATMVAAGAYLLLRLAPVLDETGWAESAVAWIGAATAVLLGLVAVAQTDLKQLLAASTCAQIGFMVLAAGVGGVFAGSLQLVAHAATKSLLFLGAGAWLVALGTKRLGELRGAARTYPLVGVTFTVGAATLAGLPPLSLWVTKDAVLAAALERSPALYAAGLTAAVVSAVYATTAVWFVWQPAAGELAGGTGRVSALMRPPLVGLAGAAAVLGLLAVPLALEPGPKWWELALSAVLAAGTVAVTWWLGDRVPAPRALADWLGLERIAHTIVVRPTLALARALARVDDAVIDGGVTAVARATRGAAAGLDRWGELSVDGMVRGIATGARALGRVARRPQTGQLHQYYAQTAAVLAVLALFVIVLR